MNQLKEIRETSFLDLNEISDHLSIPILYLNAIEEGNFAHLPQEKEIIESYIISYSEFLEVDAYPIILAYRQSQISDPMLSPRRRKNTSAHKRMDWKSFFLTYRYYLLASIVCFILIFIAWFVISSSSSVESNSPNIPIQNTTATVSQNKERPVFSLQKTTEDSAVGETWYISQANEIRLEIESLGNVNVRISEDNLKGKTVANKELVKSQSFDLNGKKWLFIHLDDPSKTNLKVNGVVIDTMSQKKETTYEFKVVSY
ncbi:helix-turn-helix domain-containing protein [Shimazuella kribbensis]|uniref:helix-turn-helix domain-containing protein n=1 Tax=Shimazuella kribbensis TaxID=139808 RepID=UPI000415A676|nr:helix-turn-helix domain-containing protein [Shimazuella kribbensis]